MKDQDMFVYASWIEKFGGFSKDMTLRDYFAGKALQGLLANPKLAQHILNAGGAHSGWIEDACYGWADAMLKVRK